MNKQKKKKLKGTLQLLGDIFIFKVMYYESVCFVILLK